ncbi:MAG: type 2 isopentenyl-diphosphate Delta-isomerase [Ignavibacteriales bacterium]|nr:type 2 isopentenyl-diphosphate Delta-isomerase [Ignavibacteriales bacterium]
MKSRTSQISSRKKEHVDAVVRNDVRFRAKKTGFERWEFIHNALPELNFAEISTSTTFLSKPLDMPFLVSAMTGGYQDAKRINRILAEVCEECRIAFGVGSQRQALENGRYHASYSIVREAAPSIPIIGNIGAAEVAKMKNSDVLLRMIELIRADAIAVHLNPLQELLQPEGNPEFRGVLAGIEKMCRSLSVPVIVKEIGCGISRSVAQRLIDAGVTIIDIAGAGGTSWAGIELLRRRKAVHAEFWDWGIPTAEALVDIASLRSSNPSLSIIASGGIEHGLDGAKAIALGADLVGCARPVLQTLFAGGKASVMEYVASWKQSFAGAMFLTGSGTVNDLRHVVMSQGVE